MPVFNLGRFYPIWKGSWSSSFSYKILDIVLYNGSSYVAKADNSSTVPSSNPDVWQLVAKSGEISGTLTTDQRDSIIAEIVTTGGFISDPNYVHTDNNLTDDDLDAIRGIGAGSLTINVNGERLGQFGANSNDNITLNIPTPTNINQLQGTDTFYRTPEVEMIDDVEGKIELAEGGKVYLFNAPIQSLMIDRLEYDDIVSGFKFRDIELYFTAEEGFTLSMPPFVRRLDNKEIIFGHTYLVTIHAGMIRVEELV